jgi:hypothetical protein
VPASEAPAAPPLPAEPARNLVSHRGSQSPARITFADSARCADERSSAMSCNSNTNAIVSLGR